MSKIDKRMFQQCFVESVTGIFSRTFWRTITSIALKRTPSLKNKGNYIQSSWFFLVRLPKSCCRFKNQYLRLLMTILRKMMPRIFFLRPLLIGDRCLQVKSKYLLRVPMLLTKDGRILLPSLISSNLIWSVQETIKSIQRRKKWIFCRCIPKTKVI